jgi:hypothetical protein
MFSHCCKHFGFPKNMYFLVYVPQTWFNKWPDYDSLSRNMSPLLIDMRPAGTLETMTSTETCKWMLCLVESRGFAQKHEGRLHHHEKFEAIQLLDNTCTVRRLQREKSF